MRITPARRDRAAALDGLILGGGADVGPNRYGQERLVSDELTQRRKRSWRRWALDLLIYPLVFLARYLARATTACYLDEERDSLEFWLLSQALARELPVLGICRGEQLLNVYCGGSLHQDLRSFYVEDPEVRSVFPRKRVDVEPGSVLERVLQCSSLRVNALHRQGVDRVGAGLRICARDRNGIVQAIELERKPLVLGVQWHPEYLPQVREQRALFEALVAAARQRRQAAGGDKQTEPHGSQAL